MVPCLYSDQGRTRSLNLRAAPRRGRSTRCRRRRNPILAPTARAPHATQRTRAGTMLMVKYPIMGLSYARGYFAICGGGGSLKSGIKNTVDIYELSDANPSGFVKVITAETGKELASGVAFSHDGLLIAVSVNAACWIYELDKKQKSMKLLVQFRTDFAEEESSQSVVRFVGNSTLLTGGEDGVVRVWKLSQEPSAMEKATGTAAALANSESDSHPKGKDDKKKPVVIQPKLGDFAINGSTMVTLTREHRGHKKRIRDIDVDPAHRNLVATSSEDQSCHLWRLNEVTTIHKFSKDDALDLAYQRLGAKLPAGPRKHQFRCVRFANDGRHLYTVLTPARGDSILIKWRPETLAQTREDGWAWVLEDAAVAGERPVASICVSPDDKFVCTAAVSGDVRVFSTAVLKACKRYASEQHSFAITGMSFGSLPSQNDATCYVVSGGADKKLIRHDIPMSQAGAGAGSPLEPVVGMLSGVVKLVLAGVLWMTIMFSMLFFAHAKYGLLANGPVSGFEDMGEMRLDSADALVSIGVMVQSLAMAFLLAVFSSTSSMFFWNGLSCLLASALAFFVAISPMLSFTWTSGDPAFDQLLDFKISIVLGAICIIFLLFHSLLALIR
ncbi:TPA: hypothetical protein N0F65_003358 [Lagenidium giganteum]|uniref:Uncharacterized protein n=1 Tax=Lagenidium giganteum TaxID=4803 RepID=A0AAV2Z9X1_9STRA|nr:TPA: hypothetical protein N0F65_003358 [Lagenidium giganteum]